jgi:CBS domain containing-hemolysin-like protein
MLIMLVATVFLLFANGFFVAAEFALVKVRITQLEARAERGEKLAVLAHEIVQHLDAYLSATQLGITLTSLGLGWIGEPAVATLLSPLFHALEVPEELGHRIAMVVGFSLISFAHIVLGEVAPKSLAIARPVQTSMAVAVPMRVFHGLFWPALIVLNASSNAILRLVGIEPAGTHSLAMPADELARIAEESAAGGAITEQQGEMLSNVFAFSHRVAREIMVPRNRAHGIDLQGDIPAQLEASLARGHSRYPAFEQDLDTVVGVLHLKDLIQLDLATLSAEVVRPLLRPPLLVPESLPAEKLMRTMQSNRTHLAMVIDEYGGVAGVVTLEDALEELVGDIQDEYDHESGVVEQLDAGYRFDGAAPMEEVAQALDVERPDSRADTLQGLLMERLQRLPRKGDRITLGAWTLEVVEVEGRRTTAAEARLRAPADEPSEG